MSAYLIKHRQDRFDTLIFAIYAWDTWISVMVSLKYIHQNKNINKICIFKANLTLILSRGDKIQDIMKYIDKAYNNLMENESEVIQQILITKARYMKTFFLSCHYFFCVFFVLAAGAPFVEKRLTCRVFVPGLNESLYVFNTPLFWLFYVWQFFFMAQALALFKFYICLVTNFLYFGTTLMEILKLKIRSLDNMSGKTKKDLILNENLMICIKFHLEIMEFVN